MTSKLLPLVAALLVAPLVAHAAGTHIGDRAPDALLYEAGTGRGVHLSSVVQQHRYTVVAFLSTRCRESLDLDSQLASARERLDASGVKILTVHSAVDDDERAIAAHVAKTASTIPPLLDANATLANILNISAVPEYVIIDQRGAVVFRGTLDADVDSAGIDDALTAIAEGRSSLDKDPPTCGLRRR